MKENWWTRYQQSQRELNDRICSSAELLEDVQQQRGSRERFLVNVYAIIRILASWEKEKVIIMEQIFLIKDEAKLQGHSVIRTARLWGVFLKMYLQSDLL